MISSILMAFSPPARQKGANGERTTIKSQEQTMPPNGELDFTFRYLIASSYTIKEYVAASDIERTWRHTGRQFPAPILIPFNFFGIPTSRLWAESEQREGDSIRS
jgi:hypothetical protein